MTDPASPALVEIDDVSKSFGDQPVLTGGMSAAGARSIREVDKEDDEDQKNDPRHAHQAGVSDGPPSLRLEAGNGSYNGDEYSDDEPHQPVHAAPPSWVDPSLDTS
jgi:hypothetical protein